MATSEMAGGTHPERHDPQPSARRTHVLVGLALVLATFAVYAQVRHHAFLTYDDPEYVLQNPNLRLAFGWEAVRRAFREPVPVWDWVPLTTLSFQLDYHLYGLDPAGYLLTNVALHALSALLLYAALARMTGARGRSAFVAAVFALHPLHVESVAWVTERKDTLSGLFFMLALWSYAWYAERPRNTRLWIVTLCLLLGLLSKATLVTLPAVLLLLDAWPLRRFVAMAPGRGVRVTAWRAVREKLPMFLLVAADAAVIFVVGRAAGGMSSLAVVPLAARIGNAFEAYVLYAVKSLWPSGLAVFYPLRAPQARLWPGLLAAALLAAMSVFVARHARKRPYLAVGWLWYLGMLVPTIGLVQVGEQARADRFMYLPLVGLSIMFAWGACDVLERLRARRFARPAAAGILAALAFTTWLQVRHWRDSIALFEHALKVTPPNAVAHLQLGSAYLAAGDADAAERHYAQAIAIDPGRAPARLGVADARLLRGDLASALEAYERELRRDPNDTLAAGRYGIALLRAGRVAEARAPLEMAVASRPGSATQQAALAFVYTSLGRTRDAISRNRAALRLDPGLQRAANDLAWLLATAADASLEERQESIELAERAMRGGGVEDAATLDTLAAAYAAGGRFDEAVATAERAAAAAGARGQTRLVGEIRERRALYAARRAYVEPSP